MSPFPPGPRGWLPGGAFLTFRRDPEAFRRVAIQYGDLSSFRVGAQRFFLINHPDLVREALVTNSGSLVKGWGPVAGNSVLGRGVLTSEGELHHQQRRLVLPSLHRHRLEEYAAVVIRHGRAMADRWPAGADVDVLAEARNVTLRVIGETLLDTDVSAGAPLLLRAISVVFSRFSGRLHPFAPLMRRIRVRSTAAGIAATRDLRDYAAELIAARRSAPGPDLVSMLLEARDEAGQPLSDEQVSDEIITIFVAGHETVALSLAWSWALLARHARAQSLLQEEVEAVLGGREPGWDDLKRLSYTQGVIAEALRLYPPQWMLGRRAVRSLQIGGWEVPKGAIILVCLSALHRDPRWFEAADEFRPERWAAGIDKSAIPFTYLPFGVAERRCVGEGFAWMESMLLLSLLASRFRVQVTNTALRTEPRLLLRPKHAVMRFERVTQSAARARSIG